MPRPASGHLTAETDLAGTKATPPYQTTFTYDTSGHLATITDPAQRKYTLAWTGNHITALSDDAGRTVTYGYDAAGNLTDVYGVGTTRTPTRKDDDHAQYTYDAHHLMTSMRTPRNFGGAAAAVTAMAYDSAERVHTQTDADGNTTTFTYGPDGGLAAGQTLVTDPSGHKTLDTYQNGLLTSEAKGYGTADAGTTSYTYDPVTLGVSTQTDPDGYVETFAYDDHGNKTSESDALGYTTNYAYDDAGDVVETIDANGVATVNQFDQAGQIPSGAAGLRDLTSTTTTLVNNVVESTTGNFGPEPTRSVSYFYDDAAHPADRTRTTDPKGHTTTETYDAFGDSTSVTDPAGDKTQYGYDTATGLRTSTVDAVGTAAGVTPGCTPPATGCTTYRYDVKGQLLQTTDALGNSTSNTYDADGNKSSSVDANGQTTGYTFDSAARLVKTTLPDTTTRVTDYNPDGTAADTIDGLGKQTVFGYDGQGRPQRRTDPDNRSTTRHLDPAGRPLTLTDPDNRTTTMGYDAAGKLTSITYSDGVTPPVGYGYDPVGHRTTMTDGTGTSSWTYDTFGELTSSKQGSGATVAYGYDDNGNQTSITYPAQTTAVARQFDLADRMSSVTDAGGNTTGFGYTRDGDVQTTTYPNGVVVTNGYDPAARLHSTNAVTGTVTDVSLTYDRDPLGQVTTRTTDGVGQGFGYTPREQLSTVTVGSASTGYDNDAADNPVRVGTATQTFDAAGQLCWTLPTGTLTNPACATTPAGATTYTFNSEAQRTGAIPATGPHSTLGYDQAGRLTTFTGPGGTAAYQYDGLGRRTGKTIGTATTSFVWDNSENANLLSDGTTSYLYGPDGLPLEQTGASGSFWYVHDNVGSTIALTNNTGANAARYSYDAYGTPIYSGTAVTPLQYTGQYADAESGFLYLRARYYDPSTAEFLTVDPQVDTTHAPYSYAGGNPANATDPSGLASLCTGAQEKHDTAMMDRYCKPPAYTANPDRCPRFNTDGPGCADAAWNAAHPFSTGTAGICIGGTIAVGEGITGSVCLTASGSSYGITATGGRICGAGGEIGITGFSSNARKPDDLGGPFTGGSASGLGPFGASYFGGPSDDGFVSVFGIAFGLGMGLWGGTTYTKAWNLGSVHAQ
ncbi:RHS repeat-associated core domain-containing protein [Amycolatopsis tolypomycina]|uniref:RHS repeat-associated core domain-containing protein n=1 Tax=Amycolatopsis tolypomycina TaxID=208445 RepID=A0A1H4Y730_9PSEU|nr:RHS repeat-associated core domain-containing protein [Amycolatopsis tolypomycina]SED13647.1 RHS repeat-associated core domain-containing protein [Amycolatopsis tolypomycina]